MKKIFSVALIIFALILVGCGNKYSDETILIGYATFVENKENIADFLDAEENDDEEFLKQQVIDGRIKYVDKETPVAVIDEMNGGKILEIKFLQGRYRNKVGYTRSDFVRDLKREKEIAKAKEDQRRAEEEKALAEQQKKEKEEKARIEQLVAEGKITVSQNGVEITCVMEEGANGTYRKLTGKTNLPEGMLLTVKVSDVEKGVTVQKDGFISALFEKSRVPIGEQNILIVSRDKNSQPASVQAFDDILGKELYNGKINVN